MRLGMIGLGRMGSNMVRRLLGAGHECVVFDLHPEAALALVKAVATAAASLAHLVARLETPRAIWFMVPAAAVDSTLDELTPMLATDDDFEGRVSDSGEGRWTLQAAIDEGVPAPVLSSALAQRFASRGGDDFANKLLSALRFQFGGHVEKH